MKDPQKGFTLAELLIVIVILGVLGSMALPRFYPQKEKAIVAEAVSMLSAIRQGEAAYHLENGEYLAVNSANPTDWVKLGIDDPNTTKWSYTVLGGTGANAADGQATATRGTQPEAGDYKNMTIVLNADGTWGPGATPHPFRPNN